MKSHKRGAGGRQNIRPNVVARAAGSTYYVLRRLKMIPDDPEHGVFRGAQQGDGVGLFWNEADALEYAKWKNETNPRT